MASSFCWKLTALLKKNLILMKRNLVTTLFEILFPILMFCLIIILRHVFPLNIESFDSLEGDIKKFVQNKSIISALDINVNLTDVLIKNNITNITDLNISDINDIANIDFSNFNFIKYIKFDNIVPFMQLLDKIGINDLDLKDIGIELFIPPLYICSNINDQKQKRPLIASIGIPQDIKNKMILDSIVYNNLARKLYQYYGKGREDLNFDFELNNNSFKEFETIEDLNKYIKDPEYINRKEEDLICFGLSFSYNETINNYNYSLHFFDFNKMGREGIQDIPTNNQGMFDKFQSGPDILSYMIYKNGAYNYMMKIVNQYILQKVTNDSNAELNYAVLPMKYTDFRLDYLGQFLGYLITIIIIVAYMIPLSLYVYRMVSEKESKTKEGMKIMGLRESEYFLSYFIQYVVISIIVSLINAFLFKVVFSHIPVYFLYVLIFLFSLDIFALIYFFQSFIEKTRIAIVLSLVIYFVMYCASFACMFEQTPFHIKIILAIMPLVNLNLGVLLLSKFEYHFRTFHNRDFFISHLNYSLFNTYVMFIVDFIFFLFLGYYLHNVLPHDFGIRRPLYFLCSRSYWCKKKSKKYITLEDKMEFPEYNSRASIVLEEEKKKRYNIKSNQKLKPRTNTIYDRSPKFESEEIYNDKLQSDVFEIRNLIKVFGDGKKAVDGVNLNFYKDEIFALLGHNGAGKTTFISMLTGMYEATAGKAIYEGNNILESDNMDEFRQKLGICPQHDTLFEDLTVREHLEMFSIFKGVQSSNVDNEVRKTLKDFQIQLIESDLARNLSAGQRRKLSIAISLIGGSQVIFLDEPSSGMDITSRRNLWEILKRVCDGKIIILTTHYMEEASVLGKRIGIINAGKMKCIGSPLFLIELYGKYMSLNITKEDDANNDTIVEFIKNLAQNVEYEVLSEEIMFRIPVKDDNKKKLDFPNFFKHLDNNLQNLKIKSYSVSMPTLEDVFLNVAAEDNKKTKEEREKEIKNIKAYDKLLFSTNQKENYTTKEKFKNDFLVCMKRRFLITKRDVKGFLMEVLGPILLVLFGLAISKLQITFVSGPYLINDLELTGKQKIIYSSLNGVPSSNYFKNDTNIQFVDLNNKIYSKIDNKVLVAQEFIEKVYDISYIYEDSQYNEVDMTDEDYEGYYASILMLSEKEHIYDFILLVNSRVKHSIPIYSYYVLKSIIESEFKKNNTNKNISLTYTHYPMPYTADVIEQDAIGNNIAIIFFIGIAFGIMPANFISLLVKERINNSKHLMRTSGINIFSYWIVNYIFEFTKYYITAGICIFFLYFFGYYKEYLYILYLTYGPGMISLTYAISFLFQNESNAQNAIILLNFLLGDLGSIVVLVLRVLENSKKTGKILQFIFALIPSFCFDFSFNLLINKGNIYTADYTKEEYLAFTGDEMIKDMNLMLPYIIFSASECLVYTIFFIIAENSSYSFKESTHNILSTNITDIEVRKEIERASSEDLIIPFEMKQINNDEDIVSIEPKILGKHEKVAVRVKNLSKAYKSGCCNRKRTIAIKNLNFVLEPGECFGLLGLNGAGKTTTFKCITQELAQDNGEITINGKNIIGNFNELNKLIGYCPQFDAIFELLTVYENLEFYARIKGIKKSLIKQLVTFMIMEMSLNEFTNKMAGRLSGGNKRKLSVAISMIGNPPIILLDEPSTGMDPEARRFMWSVIHKMSTKGRQSSVIMTTHSMDEAETLCKRMGIMVNGEFVCLGTANQIKEKYGYGYEADVRIKPMSLEMQKNILDKYNLDSDLKVNQNNLSEILDDLEKSNYLDELNPERLGERVKKAIDINGFINIGVLLNWIFFVENALKFIKTGKKYFPEIILSEHIENNFLFKLKRGNETKSIGFFFGLFEESKEECHVTEYSIQQTSLEQIFNKFASYQGKNIENYDNEDIIKQQNKGIIINDELLNKFNL